MPIPVDETPNISLDMKEFTDKTPVHYDEMNSRHKQHLDNEKALLYPTFDDSGKVSSISSFNDFLGTIKSRMRLFDFLRNFKAGMQFVMHLGRAANNCTTTSEGLYLDARQGKILMDLYTKLNSDLVKKIGSIEVSFGAGIYTIAQTSQFVYLQWRDMSGYYQLQFYTTANKIQLRYYNNSTSAWTDLWTK